MEDFKRKVGGSEGDGGAGKKGAHRAGAEKRKRDDGQGEDEGKKEVKQKHNPFEAFAKKKKCSSNAVEGGDYAGAQERAEGGKEQKKGDDYAGGKGSKAGLVGAKGRDEAKGGGGGGGKAEGKAKQGGEGKVAKKVAEGGGGEQSGGLNPVKKGKRKVVEVNDGWEGKDKGGGAKTKPQKAAADDGGGGDERGDDGGGRGVEGPGAGKSTGLVAVRKMEGKFGGGKTGKANFEVEAIKAVEVGMGGSSAWD